MLSYVNNQIYLFCSQHFTKENEVLLRGEWAVELPNQWKLMMVYNHCRHSKVLLCELCLWNVKAVLCALSSSNVTLYRFIKIIMKRFSTSLWLVERRQLLKFVTIFMELTYNFQAAASEIFLAAPFL